MYLWLAIAIAALAYVLIYYYGNISNSIRRDLTRNLSFIIISVWLLESQNALKFNLRESKFSKFLGDDITLRP